MQRDPRVIPPTAGVYALLNKKRRYAYVAFAKNLQKRSHALAHMLIHQDSWSIADLPKHPAGEWTFMLVKEVQPVFAPAAIAATTKSFEAKNYVVIGGARSPTPMIDLRGTKLTLVDAIAKTKCKTDYTTVWRRLKRGWTVEQALNLEPPPVRWDPVETSARRARIN